MRGFGPEGKCFVVPKSGDGLAHHSESELEFDGSVLKRVPASRLKEGRMVAIECKASTPSLRF